MLVQEVEGVKIHVVEGSQSARWLTVRIKALLRLSITLQPLLVAVYGSEEALLNP